MNPTQPDGEELAAPATFPVEMRARLVRRDPAALALFFDTFFERVYGYIRRLVPDEHLAEDLTQDVFLQVQRALASYDPERDPRPWLFTIATNKLRDHWRSRAHQGRGEASLDHEELVGRLPAPSAAPDASLGDEELARAVREAIDALPAGLRVTVLLRLDQGLDFAEIGRILERNEVAARKRYSRALEALREALGPLWRLSMDGRR